jgi:O-antigen/teichoic acid export membrane protein
VEQYGKAALFQTLVLAAGAVVGLSASGASAVKYFKLTASSDLDRYIGTCLCTVAIASSLLLLILLPFETYITSLFSLPNVTIVLAIATAAASLATQIRLAQWQVRGHAMQYARFQIVQSACIGLVTSMCILHPLGGEWIRIFALSAVPVCHALWSMHSLRSDGLLAYTFDVQCMRGLLSFGMPLIPHAIGAVALGVVDRLFLNSQLGLYDVGIYMLAVQLAATVGLVLEAINSAYAPWLYAQLTENNRTTKRWIVRWTYLYFIALLTLSGAGAIIAPSVITLVAGEQYRQAGTIIGWLILGQVFHGMYLAVTNYIFYSERTGSLSASTLLVALLYIAILPPMITHLGVEGAAISFSLCMGIRFLITWALSARCHPMPWALT